MSLIKARAYSRMDEGADLHSLLMTDNNTLLLGGLQNYVAEVDLTTVQETQKVTIWEYTLTCVSSDVIWLIIFLVFVLL